jgi:hypothetical protein
LRSKEIFASDMTGAQLIAVGHAAIARAHGLILLGLASILAGLISRCVGARFGAAAQSQGPQPSMVGGFPSRPPS